MTEYIITTDAGERVEGCICATVEETALLFWAGKALSIDIGPCENPQKIKAVELHPTAKSKLHIEKEKAHPPRLASRE